MANKTYLSLFLVFITLQTVFIQSTLIASDNSGKKQSGNENSQQTDSEKKQKEDRKKVDDQLKNEAQTITWEQYKNKFGKTYQNPSEENKRRVSFEKNLGKAQKPDCSPCGVSPLTDLSDQEFQQLLGSYSPQTQNTQTNSDKQNSRNLQTVANPPSSFSWRSLNVVTPVKNQKSCGSCWAFAVTGMIESEYVRRGVSTNTVDLAEQFLLKCDTGSGGCNGGNPYSATVLALKYDFPYESTYPYSYASGYMTTLYPNLCPSTTNILQTNYKLPSTSAKRYGGSTKVAQTQTIQYLLQRPIVLALYATPWQNYVPNGLPFKCLSYSNDSSKLNHAVLLTGYNSTTWEIKNSWGTGWGIAGYIYVTRDTAYDCGIGFALYSLNYTLPSPV